MTLLFTSVLILRQFFRALHSFRAPAYQALYSLVAIFICLALGYLTCAFFSILPASLYGMCYLALGLHFNWLDAQRIGQTVSFILKHIGVCFVPAGVGIMNYFGLLKASGWQLLLFTIVSTLALMVLVGWSYQRVTQKPTPKVTKKATQLSTEQTPHD
ncbi:CidA/LrgA family protein [Thalassotalea euphylliae]|nr:CidA/LrgA family protein [Thalassotalea euphylliae]